MKEIYAILPCYNEEENIALLIKRWNEQREKLNKNEYGLKIVAIDDGSRDNTKKEILQQKEIYDNVDIIIHETNRGLKGGLNSALHYFKDNAKEGDLLVIMDADNTHDPKYVHQMIEKIKGETNCVIASRYRKNAKVIGLDTKRKLMSDFAKIYYSLMLRIPNVKDYTCGYRIYNYNIINNLISKFGENPIKEESFACMMELLYKVYLAGGKFDEVGFELRYDYKKGISKMNVNNTAKRSIISAFKLGLKENTAYLCVLLILVSFSVFLSLGTNYSPLNKAILGHDCGIFSYVAFAMQKGRILYTEVWENKGPLLYFIYYLGLSINKKIGIYILETLGLFISVLFSYKTLKKITNSRLFSLMGVLYSFNFFPYVFEEGTFSESFAMPLICIGIYLFAKYIKNKETLSNIEIIFFGVLTRINCIIKIKFIISFRCHFSRNCSEHDNKKRVEGNIKMAFVRNIWCISSFYTKPNLSNKNRVFK